MLVVRVSELLSEHCIVRGQATMSLIKNVTSDLRGPVDLVLQNDGLAPFMCLPMEFSHVIDEASPLFGVSADDFAVGTHISRHNTHIHNTHTTHTHT